MNMSIKYKFIYSLYTHYSQSEIEDTEDNCPICIGMKKYNIKLYILHLFI